MADTVETRLAVLEREINQFSGLFDRLDTTIEKLTDVSTAIKQLLAIHEIKIAQHETTHRDVYDELEKRRTESHQQHIATQDKMITMESNFKKEIDDVERRITSELKDMRNDQKIFIESISKRTSTIEKWRWIVIGGAATVGWLISAAPKILELLVK
jgi:chromosome segregation ATPase